MRTITRSFELEREVSSLLNAGKTIGFVPTMGALHAGHISLVKQAKMDNDICIVSIFVNPTQFNNKEDLDQYPQTLERDVEQLNPEGVDIIFAPTEKEIYPEPDTRRFNFGVLDQVMEAKFRPGHFNGVAQVVSRLFDLVKPTKTYFGEKDFQQLAVIREMVKQLELNISIVSMPIIRETSGLALSSRNERLTNAQKEVASNIYKLLNDSLSWVSTKSVLETQREMVRQINSIDGLELEYFEIVDAHSLQTITSWDDADYIVGCIAVYCGNVRLIDNVLYKKRFD